MDFIFCHLCSIDKGLFNYNKATFWNYSIKDFISQIINKEKSLKEFNEKYNIDINDNIDELDLSNKNIGNEELKILCRLNISNIYKFFYTRMILRI